VPFGGVGADEANGALRVLKGCGGFGIGPVPGTRYLTRMQVMPLEFVEPVADFCAFEVDGEDVVAAAGKDDYGCAGVFALGCVEGEVWGGDVAEADYGFAGDEVRPWRWWCRLLGRGGDGIGRGAWARCSRWCDRTMAARRVLSGILYGD
jgi:hypothetical protein